MVGDPAAGARVLTSAPPPSSILVVEDDPHIRSLFADILQAEGWSARVAEDSLRGLERAREHEPSLAVIDLNLPGLNGRQVAHELHALYGGIPILLVTSDAPAAPGPPFTPPAAASSRAA